MTSMLDKVRRRSATPSAGPPNQADPHAELRARRDALAERVAELTWDLGGLTYEMAIRDHFRLDVLVRRAAELEDRRTCSTRRWPYSSSRPPPRSWLGSTCCGPPAAAAPRSSGQRR